RLSRGPSGSSFGSEQWRTASGRSWCRRAPTGSEPTASVLQQFTNHCCNTWLGQVVPNVPGRVRLLTLGQAQLRRLHTKTPRVQDVLEGVGILVLLQQLQVHRALDPLQRGPLPEPRLGPGEHLRG